MKKSNDIDDCVAEFARKRKTWLRIAVPTAIVLLLSSVTTEMTGGIFVLQAAGLAMLAAFTVASLWLCRCPHCNKLVVDKEDMVPGWGLKQCPHCEAPLRRRKSGP